MPPVQRIISLQMNEINFEFLEQYIERGELPNIGKLFREHGYSVTTSEAEHKNANPWIQWPTVHTGLDFADHQVFRLGDIVHTDFEHIYERLESHGLTVGAFFPFNAKNNTKNAAFFVPDPWTQTSIDAPWDLQLLYKSIVQVADDYATARISISSLLRLGTAGLVNMRWRGIPKYLRDVWRYRTRRWYRALICDRLVADTAIRHWKKSKPDYTSVFLNGGAHLQHHYLCSAAVYQGDRSNPEWYVPPGNDPVLDIYQVYDEIVGDMMALCKKENARLWITTALRQVAHERTSTYYRMDDHTPIMDAFKVPYKEIHPLMTEDFVLKFESEELARQGQAILETVRTDLDDVFFVDTADVENRTSRTNALLFYVDNRGKDLYVQLKPTIRALPKGMRAFCDGGSVENFETLVSFVQIKNAHHEGDGFFVDTGFKKGELPAKFPLRELFGRTLEAFGIAKGKQPAASQPVLPTQRV